MITRSNPRVSIVMPFLNTPAEFFKEAIESVLAQTYRSWELLLVDDGSSTECVDIAEYYRALHPGRITCLEHAAHQNRGSSESRNLGIAHAKGDYVAFLDSDDVWLPEKLTEQVAILESQPEAAALYGNTKYWYSWTGRPCDLARDFSPDLGVRSETLLRPPLLLSLFLRRRAAVPCTCSLLVRREAIEAVGGFEARFRGMYDDHVFYSKLALQKPIYVSTDCWDKYRRHPGSMCALAADRGQLCSSRVLYLRWLRAYVIQQGCKTDIIAEDIQRELWLCSSSLAGLSPSAACALRLLKKWLLRAEDALLPACLSRWLWRLPDSR